LQRLSGSGRGRQFRSRTAPYGRAARGMHRGGGRRL